MGEPLKVRGEAPLPEAGEGIFLFFRNSELAVLEQEMGGQWFPQTVDKFLKGDVHLDFVQRLAKMGAKKRNPEGKRISATIDEDTLDEIPVAVLAERIFDGLCYAMHGQAAKEYVEERLAAWVKAVEAGEDTDPSPLSPDSNPSTTSEGAASGQE
jgi:hypothetical protein